MSDNAALYLHPGGYDTSGPELLGRLSAGESFLRGYLRHAQVDQYWFWNVAGRPQDQLDSLLARIEPPAKPVRWIGQHDRIGLGEPGVMYLPMPTLAQEAWRRAPVGARAYGICGVTHTTATDRVMQAISEMLVAPTDGHDALICTSTAVRHAVDTQLEGMRAYIAREFGPRKRPEPMRVTIPLGVNTADFTTSGAERKAWREKLDIPEDAVVALFMGRFNVRAKMNPALMALSLEGAARRTKRPICWVNAGWSAKPDEEAQYHALTRAMCPSVLYRSVDGRPADVRFSIWSVADFFISFSDNIQETFGLTPIEAMAAGLPCVVTDWDGYKDTVRHGVDGFRIATVAPGPGEGRDLAEWYENGWMSYDHYVGAAGQFTAIDYAAAQQAIAALVLSPDLRRQMGAAAKARAREVFDWAAVIPQYQALWAEQNARRLAAPPEAAQPGNPYRPDPFTLFQSYPTRHLSARMRLRLAPGATWPVAEERLKNALVNYSPFHRPTLAEARQMLELLAERGTATVFEVSQIAGPARRRYVARGVLWLARYGLITILED